MCACILYKMFRTIYKNPRIISVHRSLVNHTFFLADLFQKYANRCIYIQQNSSYTSRTIQESSRRAYNEKKLTRRVKEYNYGQGSLSLSRIYTRIIPGKFSYHQESIYISLSAERSCRFVNRNLISAPTTISAEIIKPE